jgi:hypothetical protein
MRILFVDRRTSRNGHKPVHSSLAKRLGEWLTSSNETIKTIARFGIEGGKLACL